MQFLRTMTCVALVGVAAPAAAQDQDWGGAYAGAQLEFTSVGIDSAAGADLNDGSGVMFGAFGGYRYDLGQVVFGASGSAQFGRVNVDPAVVSAQPDPTLDMILRAGIEIGYDLGPVLVSGGIGQAFAVMTNPSNQRQSEFGYYFGIGADYMLNEDIMIGADISRNVFNDFSGNDVRGMSFGIGAAYRF